jgi:hypothetical protein
MSLTRPGVPTPANLPQWITHADTRFRVVSFAAPVDADIAAAWDELAGNYVNVHKIQRPIVDSHALPGEPHTGPGAVRHCDIDFNGRPVSVKERIIDWIDGPAYREYTYDVYETRGFPARAFNTWSIRETRSGSVELRNVFYFRMRPALLTRPFTSRIATAARNGVLGYKHYLETGQGGLGADELAARYNT